MKFFFIKAVVSFFSQCQYFKSYVNLPTISTPKKLNLFFSSISVDLKVLSNLHKLHYTQYGILIVFISRTQPCLHTDTSPQLSHTGL